MTDLVAIFGSHGTSRYVGRATTALASALTRYHRRERAPIPSDHPPISHGFFEHNAHRVLAVITVAERGPVPPVDLNPDCVRRLDDIDLQVSVTSVHDYVELPATVQDPYLMNVYAGSPASAHNNQDRKGEGAVPHAKVSIWQESGARRNRK